MSFYLPPTDGWYFTVAKILPQFSDRLTGGSGTGFFLLHKNKYYLVTARHVLDPKYRPQNEKWRDTTCQSFEFEYSLILNPGTENIGFAAAKSKVVEPNILFGGDDNDLAIVEIPQEELPVIDSTGIHRPMSFASSMVATRKELSERHAGESICFIGFPENSPIIEYQGENEGIIATYPLFRQGVLAYPLSSSVKVPGYLGKNYGILDAYANSGFSGAPIISLQRGWPDGVLTAPDDFRPARVVGVVCGHYQSSSDRVGGKHSGMSYFVRSDSIWSLLDQIDSEQS